MPDNNISSYEDFTDGHRAHIEIVSNALYRHKTLELHYTTYDMQEDKDVIYQRLHPDVMILSDDDEHPYLYGRVLDIFHVDVKNNGPGTMLETGAVVTIPMVWVRWLRLDTLAHCQSGFNHLRYPSVSFYHCGHPDAFGLIHPDEIVRAVHLLPRFRFGRTAEYLGGPSEARPKGEKEDWMHFSVNMSVMLLLVDEHPSGGTDNRV